MQLSTHIYQYKLISPAKHAVITPVLLGIKTKSAIMFCLVFSSKPCHHFHHNLVSLRREGSAAVAIEIFLVVQTDVADERFLQTQSDATCDTGALVVVHCQFAHLVCLAVEIAFAVAVVAHIVVAQERCNIADESVASRNIVAHERVEGMDGTEGIVGIMLI